MDKLTVDEKVLVTVKDTNGNVIKVVEASSDGVIDISDLPKGSYMFEYEHSNYPVRSLPFPTYKTYKHPSKYQWKRGL